MEKVAFNRKIFPLTNKLNIISGINYLEHCIVRLRDLDTMKIEAGIFNELRLDNIKCQRK